jgi:dTMP kinase
MYTAYARDRVRGCDPKWLEGMYSFAHKPEMTFYFDVPLQVSLDRILGGRPRLKYHEAGMDLNLHPDIRESFKIFQGHIVDAYKAMAKPNGFIPVDGTRPIHVTQQEMRKNVEAKLDLPGFQKRGRLFAGGDA